MNLLPTPHSDEAAVHSTACDRLPETLRPEAVTNFGANDETARAKAGERFQFLDGLRGFASLAVAGFHIFNYGPLWKPAATLMPHALQAVLDHGWMGVQVFFVLSGFVIAYSVRNARITPAFFGNFVLRRIVRLDPPYWVAIVLVVAMSAIATRFFDDDTLTDPVTWPQLLAHAFYLQNILRLGNISVGFWTLCIEVQFYLAFILLLGLAQRMRRTVDAASHAASPLALLLVTGPWALLSLWVYHTDGGLEDWLVQFFCMFYLGVLAFWSLEGRVPKAAFWTYVALMLARLSMDWALQLAVALVAAVTIYCVGRAGHLRDWLSWRWIQYLGRISYSLYLVHYPVSWLLAKLGYAITRDQPVMAAGWLAVSLLASIGAAQLMYTFVEAPSVRLAKRLQR